MKKHIGIGSMILSGLFFAGVWIFSKAVVQDIAPMLFTTLRMIIALVVLSAIGYKYIPEITKVQKSDWGALVLASVVGMAGMAIAFTYSVKYTTVTNSSFLFFLPIILLPVFGAIVGRVNIKRTTYIALVCCVRGLYSIFDPNIVGTSLKGNLFGVAAGIFYIIYLLVAKRLSHLPPKLLSIIVFGVQVIALLLITLVVEGFPVAAITGSSRILLLYIGGCVGGAYFFVNLALQYLSPYLIGVLSIAEPLFATLLGVLFLGEITRLSTTLGLIAIVIGFVLISLDKKLLAHDKREQSLSSY